MTTPAELLPHPNGVTEGSAGSPVPTALLAGYVELESEMHMAAPSSVAPRPFASEDYWRRIFTRNPDFCSWQSAKQAHVRDVVRA